MPFDGQTPAGRERAINLPPATLWLIVINVAVHALFAVGGLDDNSVFDWALVPARYTVGELDADVFSLLVTPITFQFLHGGWVHLLVNMVSLAAFGSPLERLLGGRRYVLFYLLGGIAGGAAHVAAYPESVDAVVGASGGVSALFGGVLIAMRRGGRMPQLGFLVLFWIGITVLFGVMGAPGSGGEPVAWVAHIGGFLFGLLAVGLFLPRRQM